jgi:hypothetical protein
VRADIEKAMRRAHTPRKPGGNRRRGEVQPAPDVSFRWRPRERGSRSRDRQS